MNNKRVRYLDYGKALGILLIVFAHVTQYFPPTQAVCYFVCSFHVPIFFILGGCLSCCTEARVQKGGYAANRIRGLLIPYAVFSFINSALKFAVMFLQGSITAQIIREELIQLFITGNGTVWFLVTYLAVELLFFCIQKSKNRELLMMCAGVVGIVLPYLLTWNTNPVGILIVRVIAAFGYYSVGYFVTKYCDINKIRASRSLLMAVVFAAVNLVVYITLGNGFAFFEGNFTKPVASLLNSFGGAFAVVFFANYLGKAISHNSAVAKMLSYLGQNSLAIMLVHPTILLVFTYPLRNILLSTSGILGVLGAVLLLITVILLDVPCIYILKNYFPWTLGKFEKR